MPERMNSKKYLLDQARQVRTRTGKSLLKQAIEIVRLRLGPGKLYPSEYYELRVFDDSRFPGLSKEEVLSTRLEGSVTAALNSSTWDMIEEDKLMTYSVLSGMSLPIPKIYAVYHHRGRHYGGVPTLRTPMEVAAFIRHGMPYPFFAKPVQGSFGRGGLAVVSHDPVSDTVLLANGKSVTVEAFVQGLERIEGRRPMELGYIFQEYLTPHPLLADACANISSIRLLVLLHDEGPRIFRAIWKVPRRGNMTDNFHHGTSGNMLAWIDATTGTVQRVVAGVGLNQKEVLVHPDTGRTLVGLALPDWQKLLELGLTASATFPLLRLLHFDIALSDRGPVLLEINVLGSFDLVQLPASRGLYDEELREFLARYGLQDATRRRHRRAVERFARKKVHNSGA